MGFISLIISVIVLNSQNRDERDMRIRDRETENLIRSQVAILQNKITTLESHIKK
jgi:hypothetical protein